MVPVKVQREGENCLRGRKQKEEGQIRGGDEGLGLMDLVPSGDSGDLPAGGGAGRREELGLLSMLQAQFCGHYSEATTARGRGEEALRAPARWIEGSRSTSPLVLDTHGSREGGSRGGGLERRKGRGYIS